MRLRGVTVPAKLAKIKAEHQHFRGCSNKKRFMDEPETGATIARYGGRAYHCSFCDGWHITSQPKSEMVESAE